MIMQEPGVWLGHLSQRLLISPLLKLSIFGWTPSCRSFPCQGLLFLDEGLLLVFILIHKVACSFQHN